MAIEANKICNPARDEIGKVANDEKEIMIKLKTRITNIYPNGHNAYLDDAEIKIGIKIAGGKSFSRKKACLRAAENLEKAALKFREMAENQEK